MQTPERLGKRFNLDIRTKSEVTKIDRANKSVEVKNWETGKIYTEKYDKLVLAPGAEPIKPPIPGINSKKIFTLRSIPDTDKIKEIVDTTNPKEAVVIGGGFIGLEMAENLYHRGLNVTLIEMSDQVMGILDFEMAAIIHQHMKLKNIRVLLKDGVKSFVETEQGITT